MKMILVALVKQKRLDLEDCRKLNFLDSFI